MHFIASVHHRRSDICPRTHITHESAGTEASSRWVMLQDGEHLADVAAAEADPEMFSLLQELRISVPTAQFHMAICRAEDFPSPATVCRYHANPAKNCSETPTPRRFEISSLIPGPDMRRPKAKCSRCTDRDYQAISAAVHKFLGTEPLAPVIPPAAPAPTPAEMIASRRRQAVDDLAKAMNGVATQTIGPRAAADLLAGAIETLIAIKQAESSGAGT